MRWFNPTSVGNSSKGGRGYTKTGLNSGTCLEVARSKKSIPILCPWKRGNSLGTVNSKVGIWAPACSLLIQETWSNCPRLAPLPLKSCSYCNHDRRPSVYVNDLFLDPEVQTLQSYTMAFGQFQQDICLWGMNQDPKDSEDSPLYAPGTQVLIKILKDGSPKAQVQPTWKGPYPVILSIPTAVKVPGHDSLDSLLTSQAMEENRRRPSIHLWAPGRSQIPI